MTLAIAAAVLALTGCGTTEREGGVGDTLDGRFVAATLLDFRERVPAARRGDLTGFGTPGEGNRFAAAHVSLCTDSEQAIRAYDFVLEHDAGESRPKLPQSVLEDFDVVRDDCERGWLVYAIPRDAKASALTFAYDNTGSSRPGDRGSHLRFRWSLG